MTSTWVRRGERKRVPSENPQGRRVNALAALVKHGAAPALFWVAKPGSLDAHHLIAFLHELPPVPVPTVVVLDNGSIHRSTATRAAVPVLWARGVSLHFLPAYSRELNEIEPAFRVIKHEELPERRYATVPALLDAIRTAFTTYREHSSPNFTTNPGQQFRTSSAMARRTALNSLWYYGLSSMSRFEAQENHCDRSDAAVARCGWTAPCRRGQVARRRTSAVG